MNDADAVAWLRAQIEGDKAAAVALASYGTGHWSATKNDDFDYSIHDRADAMADVWREDIAEWIAAHGPQDAIADCEAKLAILDECDLLLKVGIAYPDEAGPESATRIVRLMAQGYRHRSGYTQHWGSGD